jgi:diacylglycerol kinase family enzyme
VALHGDRVRLDVAAMDDDRFVVMGGIGFDAAMLRDADPKLKERVGAVAYVVSGFRNLRRRATRFRLRLDDRPPLERTGQGVLVGNLGRLQGGLPVMPDARPDDGLLDVAVLRTRTMLDWLALAARVVARRRRKDPQLELFTARRVEVSCDRPQPVERDGDTLDTPRDHLVVEVVPAALTLCVPQAKGSSR